MTDAKKANLPPLTAEELRALRETAKHTAYRGMSGAGLNKIEIWTRIPLANLDRLLADLLHAHRAIDDLVKERWDAVRHGRSLGVQAVIDALMRRFEHRWLTVSITKLELVEILDAFGPAPEPLPIDRYREEAARLRAENERLVEVLRQVAEGLRPAAMAVGNVPGEDDVPVLDAYEAAVAALGEERA